MSSATALNHDDIIQFANDGKWPQRSNDPEWLALIELAGGYDACMAAEAELDDGRLTTAEVRAELKQPA
jgi:hypothetical protein